MSLDALEVELLEPSENWKYRLCSSCSEILCTSLQNKQSTFLNDLTDTTLDVYCLLYFLCIMGWSSVFESSNIRGLQEIAMGQPKLFNADFAVKTSEFRGC